MFRQALLDFERGPLPGRAAPLRAAALPAVARKLADRYGSGGEPRKSPRQLAALLHRLRAVQYRWDEVGAFDRLDVAWVLWSGPEPPAEQEAFLSAYLAWAAAPFRRVQARRMAIAWAAAFDPERRSIQIVGEWLAARAASLGAPWTSLAETQEIFSVARAPVRLAEAFLVSDEGEADFFDRLGLKGRAAAGGLLLEALSRAAGPVEARLAREPRLAGRLARLSVHEESFRPATLTRLTPDRAQAVRRKIPEALLLPWQDSAPPPDVRALTIDFLLRHYGDSRLPETIWEEHRPAARIVMNRWLTATTIELFFRLIGALSAEDPRRWQVDHDFVNAYGADIDHAWLLAGPRSVAALSDKNIGYGRLAGCRPELCALLLRIRGVTIVATNDEKSWRTWLPGNDLAPPLYGGRPHPLYPAALSIGADFSPNFSRADDGLWQDRLHDFLEARTGIHVQRNAYRR